MSDFTRSELLGHLHSDRFANIEQRIAELQSIVTRLTYLLEGVVMPALHRDPKSGAPSENPC